MTRRTPHAETRRRLYQQQRQAVADLYFDGDTDKADAVLESLPYSCIPDWHDVITVLETLAQLGRGTSTVTAEQLDAAGFGSVWMLKRAEP